MDVLGRIGRGDDAGAGPLSVLAVASEVPWPLNTGGHIRTFHLLRALARRFRVRLVAPVRVGEEPAIEALARCGIILVPVRIGPRVVWRECLRVLGAVSRQEPYVLYRRHNHRALHAALRAEIGREPPDVFYLEELDSLLYRSVAPNTPAIIDLQNIYSTLTRRAAMEQSSPWLRLFLRREAALLARIERRAACETESLLIVSAEDRRHFVALGARRAHVVPNGVDCAIYENLPLGRSAAPPLLLYVGALSWGPNVAAVRFLAEEVLPQVRLQVSDARVRIVGRDPVPEVRALGRLPGVELLGSVPDVVPHLRDAALLAVPLNVGGGTRLKILEAFAAGLPVVSTPIGCEGIDALPGEHLLVADREHFGERVLALLSDGALGEQLAKRARALALERYDWSIAGEAVCAAVATVTAAHVS